MTTLYYFLLCLILQSFHSSAWAYAPQQVLPQPLSNINASTEPHASAVIKNQANQPIYLTLASEAKASTSPNYTLIAAIVAALAALTSAGISAFIALKSKEKDFSNDYYKKIIDKRLKAYEEIEQVLFILRTSAQVIETISGETKSVTSIFMNEESFDSVIDKVHEVIKKGIWLSEELKQELIMLNNKLIDIKTVARPTLKEIIDTDKLIELGIINEDAIEEARNKMSHMLAKDIINMKDVTGFFNKLLSVSHKVEL